LPVTWETEPYDWKQEKLTFPVFSPATGKLELQYELPFRGKTQRQVAGFDDEFDSQTLNPEWNFRRAPEQRFHELEDGSLRLRLQPGTIAEREQYSFVGIRQRHFEFNATTSMTFAPESENEEAGLVVVQNDRSAFLMIVTDRDDAKVMRLVQSMHGESEELAVVPVDSASLFLRVTGDYLSYQFEYSIDGASWTEFGDAVDGTALSPATITGFNYTGVYIGLFASSNGETSGNHADFDFFRYEPTATARDGWFHRQASKRDSHASR